MNSRFVWKGAAIAAVGLGLVAGALAQATGGAAASSSGNAAKNAFAENSEIFLGVGLVKTSARQVSTLSQEYSEDSPASWDLDYRYHATDTVAFDIRYAYSKGTHSLGPVYSVDAYEGEWSGDAAYTFPTSGAVKPYVMAGAGLLWFGPNSSFLNTPGADGQGRFAYVWGAGADVKLSDSVSFRAEYRGLYYEIPDFSIGKTTMFKNQLGDVWTIQSIPTIGLVIHF